MRAASLAGTSTFCIEITGILINYCLQELLSYTFPDGYGVLPSNLSLQSSWLGLVLKTSVNNSPLRWQMHEGEKDGVDLWLWIKVKYESADISDPLRIYYAEKIRSLKLRANGSLHNYIDRFQGLDSHVDCLP